MSNRHKREKFLKVVKQNIIKQEIVIEESLKHINDEMDSSAEEFYSNKKEKEDDLSL